MKKILILMMLMVTIAVSATGFEGVYIGNESGTPVPVNGAGLSVSSFYVEVAKGNVPGHSAWNKYGRNAAAEGGDSIWSADGAYSFYPSTAGTVWIQSSSAADDVGGTGVYSVIVYGLNSNRLHASEIATMDGTTPVMLTNKYWRLFRSIGLATGTSPSNVGNISVTNSAGTIGTYIAAGTGESQQSNYTTASNTTSLFVKGYVGLGNATFQGETGHFELKMRLNNGVKGPWLVKGDVDLINIGNSFWQYLYGVPVGMIPGCTDINIILQSATDTMSTTCGYDLIEITDGY